MTAGDGKVAVPGKSLAVRPPLWSKDGTDGFGAVPSVLEKSRTAHRPRPSEGTVDITGLARSVESTRSFEVVLVHSRRRFLRGVPSQFTEAHLL